MLSPCSLCRWLKPDCPLRRRLLDFGFTRGAVVCPLFRAPSGAPTAYRIGGTVLALRDADAADVIVAPAETRGV